jgi:hypothetical protein
MTSRERLTAVLNHEAPDRVPLDLGATGQTGINASTLYRLRRALGFEEAPVKIIEPFQMLGEVDRGLRDYLHVDVIGLWNRGNLMGNINRGWKPWIMPDGTPVLMAGGFECKTDSRGDTLVFPQGDRTAPPSLKLPQGGYFFDNIDRAPEWDEDDLDAVRDFKNLYSLYSDDDARHIETQSKYLYEETDYGIIMNFGGGGLGDAAIIPGPWEKHPRGIRKLDDWYVAHILYPSYIKELFEMQTEIALRNLETIKQAAGERIQVINISGTDFGSQNGEIISPDQYREFYKPYHKKMNDWVHDNTNWRTHYHCCGSILHLLDDFVECGVDVLNPVQCSACGMDPQTLKDKYGDTLVFWGGGVDTQKTLPFGTPEEVREQVKSRLEIFSSGGGFVFNTIHNIVAKTPVENLIAMFEELAKFNE